MDRAIEELMSRFANSRGRQFAVVRAPGRANLLGGHTDYNEGYVLPIATAQATYIAAAPRDDGCFRVWSSAFDAVGEFGLADCRQELNGPPWTAYLKAVVAALTDTHVAPRGLDAVIVGDLPIRAGVASSASLEVAFARTCLTLSGQDMPPRDLALLCQRAENEFVGVRCGILDQYSSVFGRQDAAILIDCRSLKVAPVQFGYDRIAVVICDTGKPRGLVESRYNALRAQCEQAGRQLGVPSLRDATMEALEDHRQDLGETTFRRARHVVTENERVLRGAQALREGDPDKVGALLLDAHRSLRDDYEVSCPELDAMVEAAMEAGGCWGARLVGAGFGGCVVAVVEASHAPQFCETVVERYHARTGLQGKTLVTRPSGGVTVLCP